MKKTFHSICVSALAAAVLSGCAEKKQAVRAESVPTVETAKPLVADVEEIGSYSVRIRANEDVEIRARVGGYIERVCFEKGARVEKGQLLFKIDDRPFAAALAAAEANVKAAESKIVLAEENAQRARGLFKRNAISKEAYQTRETELLVIKAKLLEAKAAERNARLNLEYTDVVAPVSGRIGENFVDAGNLVASSTRLARIVDDSTVGAYFELNAADAVRYKNAGLLKNIDAKNGADVEVKMNSDGVSYAGRLVYYDNALGAGTSSLVLRADVRNSDGGLMVGSFGKIRVREGVRKNALLVPEDAIGTDLAGRFVYAVEADGKVRQLPVSLGAAVENLRVVESGISADTAVIVRGIQRASAGRTVKPEAVEIARPSSLK